MKTDNRIVLFVILSVAFFAVFATGCAKEQEAATAMGRYTEREITVDGGCDRMDILEDGGYALTGKNKNLVLVYSDGSTKSHLSLWKNSLAIGKEMQYAVSRKGEMIFAYIPTQYGKELTVYENTLLPYNYAFVDKIGIKRVINPYGDGFVASYGLDYFAFAPDGRLYACDKRGKVYRLDTETGELTLLFQAEHEIVEFGFSNDILIALDDAHVWLFNTKTDRQMESVLILDEFVQSHQTDEKSIVICTKEIEGNTVLYLGCRTGLYRYIWGGSIIEQIADGRFLTFGNSLYSPLSMQALENGNFRVFFTSSRMMELYYDEAIPTKPDKELKVYSLQDDDRIRYAAQLFQEQYPDVMVNYETGVSGDNAMTDEEAIENLNTKLLSGEGPDVLVLDGLDIEQYVKMGVLKELDSFLKPYLSQNIIYENIVDAMRCGDDNTVYALPLTIQLPVWISDSKYLNNEESLVDIVAGMEQARKDHREGALFFVRNEKDLLRMFIGTCLPAWKKRNGGIDGKQLTEYYEAMSKLWELHVQGMTAEDREWFQEQFSTYTREQMLDATANGMLTQFNNDHIWAVFGFVDSIWEDGVNLSSAKKTIWQQGKHYKNMERVEFDIFYGQAKHVFWAQSMTGINAHSKEEELALKFYRLLLSDEMMEKWWLNAGLPITRNTFSYCLSKEGNMEYENLYGYDTLELTRMESWPFWDELSLLEKMMESAEVLYQPDTTTEETALEVGERVLQGELTPQEGADEVSRRMAAALEK